MYIFWMVVSSFYDIYFLQGYGYLLYRHIFTQDVVRGKLSVPGIRDRGYVMINDVSTLYM